MSIRSELKRAEGALINARDELLDRDEREGLSDDENVTLLNIEGIIDDVMEVLDGL